MTMLKGFHVAPDFNAPLLNAMNCGAWVGTDGILEMVWDTARHGELAGIQGEYIHRAPGWSHPYAIAAVKQFPAFGHKWILTNEYDLHYSVTDSVAIIEALVTNILAAYPNPGIPQLYLNMGSNVTDLTHHTAVWNALAPAIKNEIDGFTFHRYRVLDWNADPAQWGVDFRTDARQASQWMNQRGLGALKLYCGEFGLDAAYHDQDTSAAFLESVWAAMAGVNWCDGLLWYFANAGNLDYTKLLNDPQTKLTKTGRALRDAI